RAKAASTRLSRKSCPSSPANSGFLCRLRALDLVRLFAEGRAGFLGEVRDRSLFLGRRRCFLDVLARRCALSLTCHGLTSFRPRLILERLVSAGQVRPLSRRQEASARRSTVAGASSRRSRCIAR